MIKRINAPTQEKVQLTTSKAIVESVDEGFNVAKAENLKITNITKLALDKQFVMALHLKSILHLKCESCTLSLNMAYVVINMYFYSLLARIKV